MFSTLKSLVFPIALVLGTLSLSACETVEGAGEDIENAGESIQDAAE